MRAHYQNSQQRNRKFSLSENLTRNSLANRLSALGSTETLQIKPIENEECEKMCSKAKEPEINKEIPSTSQVTYNKIVKTDTPRNK